MVALNKFWGDDEEYSKISDKKLSFDIFYSKNSGIFFGDFFKILYLRIVIIVFFLKMFIKKFGM